MFKIALTLLWIFSLLRLLIFLKNPPPVVSAGDGSIMVGSDLKFLRVDPITFHHYPKIVGDSLQDVIVRQIAIAAVAE